jgi:hypothetical protein
MEFVPLLNIDTVVARKVHIFMIKFANLMKGDNYNH